MSEAFRSRVYTDRPAYADFDPPRKFQAIQSIIAKRLREHPNATCSYSGGSDSDILLDLIERTRDAFGLPPVHYAFFNTGLEGVQKKQIPLSIATEYAEAEDKAAKRAELRERYPKCESTINFLCGCNAAGEPRPDIQLVIGSSKYMLDFITENPIPFRVSNKCCTYCKKQVAHRIQKDFEMTITGERRDEGGMRSVPRKDNTSMCFTETADGTFRLRPLYYVSDADKQWYKDHYGIRYSDAYEVYGLKRTGCCGCPISSRAVADLEQIRPYEPNLVKAAWAVFGPSYLYRQKYNAYRAKRNAEAKSQTVQSRAREQLPGQIGLMEEGA